MISRHPTRTSTKPSGNGFHRLDILRTFYYQAVMGALVPDNWENVSTSSNKREQSRKTDKKEERNVKKTNKTECTVNTETYWCSEYHKCHAMLVEDNVLCVLYNSTIPTYSMRFITPKVLKTLVTDKQLCW